MNGFIAIVDVLGAKELDPKVLYKKLCDLDNAAKHHCKKLEEISSDLLNEFRISVFGDTFIFSWPDFGYTNDQFLWFCHYAGIMIRESIYRDMPLRGAIAYGDIYRPENNMILGQAINDAAYWYDKSKWIGIFITPLCCNILNSFWSTDESIIKYESARKHFIASRIITPRYEVPLKDYIENSNPLDTKVINWMQFKILNEGERNESIREFKRMNKENIKQLKKLRKIAPKNARIIYDNTLAFLDWNHRKLIKTAKGKESLDVFL